MRSTSIVFILSCLGLFACSNTATETDCRAGSERCPCYGNMTCDDGLVCGSNRCVRPPKDAGTFDSGANDLGLGQDAGPLDGDVGVGLDTLGADLGPDGGADIGPVDAGPGCGDGIVQSNELCDGAMVNGVTCADLGFYVGGAVVCNSTCSGYEARGCIPQASCGNGIVDNTEACDGSSRSAFFFSDCVSWGLGEGTVSCTSICTPDFSGCSEQDDCLSLSGNGFCDPCELWGQNPDPECDLCGRADDWCPEYYTRSAGAWSCALARGVDDPDCTCGDGVAQEAERCDGMDLRGATCENLAFPGGTLGCSAGCILDASGCTECTGDPDCASFDNRGLCDLSTGVCEACLSNTDCDAGQTCHDGNCHGMLAVGSACTSATQCDAGTCFGGEGGYCSGACEADTDCDATSHCVLAGTANAFCGRSCQTSADCREPEYGCRDWDDDMRLECMPTGGGSGAVGDPCEAISDCAGGDLATCFEGNYWLGGYCSLVSCTSQAGCPSNSHCGYIDPTTNTGFCMRDCASNNDCRGPDYGCWNADDDSLNLQECAPVASGAGEIGDPCESIADCGGGISTFCSSDPGFWPEGYCRKTCTLTSSTSCPPGSHCSGSADPGVCMRDCASSADCRTPSYECYDWTAPTGLECAPFGAASGAIGSPCNSLSDCGGGQYAICANLGPYGYCSVYCRLGGTDCAPGSVCSAVGNTGLCLRSCVTSDDCRPFYDCIDDGLGSMVCSAP